MCSHHLNSISDFVEHSEENLELFNLVANKTEGQPDGRLIMPILWNAQNCHLLRSNFNICKTILQ